LGSKLGWLRKVLFGSQKFSLNQTGFIAVDSIVEDFANCLVMPTPESEIDLLP
jgi:hypothetical protein